ncbi:hypothetical protein K7X08_016569 [Anisodus acutangulus]|uniref:NAC domain-containing protein n=1 Tax=Anisodus acutangulus TaxID=402998 RepID=A0A9Q1R059_9SOLA|nr:hypothetical protein K7X08_016569 [Anisodus acutangulus]
MDNLKSQLDLDSIQLKRRYYLKKKVANEKIDLDVIQEVDLNKLEPWDILEKCKIGSTPQNDWYFFSHKDKKYPTGTRTNRATVAGFWKATGRDKVIYSNSRRIGMRKTLVFYKSRAPHGQNSDWIMHEYRLDDHINDIHSCTIVCNVAMGESTQEEGWVVCRIFKKKNDFKSLETINPSTSQPSDPLSKQPDLPYPSTQSSPPTTSPPDATGTSLPDRCNGLDMTYITENIIAMGFPAGDMSNGFFGYVE